MPKPQLYYAALELKIATAVYLRGCEAARAAVKHGGDEELRKAFDEAAAACLRLLAAAEAKVEVGRAAPTETAPVDRMLDLSAS